MVWDKFESVLCFTVTALRSRSRFCSRYLFYLLFMVMMQCNEDLEVSMLQYFNSQLPSTHWTIGDLDNSAQLKSDSMVKSHVNGDCAVSLDTVPDPTVVSGDSLRRPPLTYKNQPDKSLSQLRSPSHVPSHPTPCPPHPRTFVHNNLQDTSHIRSSSGLNHPPFNDALVRIDFSNPPSLQKTS